MRASLVVLREWAGPAAAYAAGAASVTDERAMLLFVPWGVKLAEDAFVAYERMLRGYGESVVAYAPVRGNGASRLPVVAVEAAAWRSMSKPDVGYVLEGGVAAWLAALSWEWTRILGRNTTFNDGALDGRQAGTKTGAS